MTTLTKDHNNHPAHAPLTTRRLHQMRDILSKAAAQRDGGDIGYAMSDAVKLIDEVLARRAAAFEATFPRENPEPLDWRVPIQDEETRQMCESLEERCRTIIEAALRPVPVVQDDGRDQFEEWFKFHHGDEHSIVKLHRANGGANYRDPHVDLAWIAWKDSRAAMLQAGTLTNEGTISVTQIKPVADLYGITSPTGSETSFTFDPVEACDFIDGGWLCQEYVELERYQQAAAGNPPAVQLPTEFYSENGIVVQLEKVMAALALHGIEYKRNLQAPRVSLRDAVSAIKSSGIEVDVEKILEERGILNSPVAPDGLSTVCAEAYQVIGVMAEALDVFDDAAVQKALDNLSQQKLVHSDVLPFSLPAAPQQEVNRG